METGTVTFFNEKKGFGYIKISNSPREIFVHVTGLLDEIHENDEVIFNVRESKKGLNAINVKLI